MNKCCKDNQILFEISSFLLGGYLGYSVFVKNKKPLGPLNIPAVANTDSKLNPNVNAADAPDDTDIDNLPANLSIYDIISNHTGKITGAFITFTTAFGVATMPYFLYRFIKDTINGKIFPKSITKKINKIIGKTTKTKYQQWRDEIQASSDNLKSENVKVIDKQNELFTEQVEEIKKKNISDSEKREEITKKVSEHGDAIKKYRDNSDKLQKTLDDAKKRDEKKRKPLPTEAPTEEPDLVLIGGKKLNFISASVGSDSGIGISPLFNNFSTVEEPKDKEEKEDEQNINSNETNYVIGGYIGNVYVGDITRTINKVTVEQITDIVKKMINDNINFTYKFDPLLTETFLPNYGELSQIIIAQEPLLNLDSFQYSSTEYKLFLGRIHNELNQDLNKRKVSISLDNRNLDTILRNRLGVIARFSFNFVNLIENINNFLSENDISEDDPLLILIKKLYSSLVFMRNKLTKYLDYILSLLSKEYLEEPKLKEFINYYRKKNDIKINTLWITSIPPHLAFYYLLRFRNIKNKLIKEGKSKFASNLENIGKIVKITKFYKFDKKLNNRLDEIYKEGKEFSDQEEYVFYYFYINLAIIINITTELKQIFFN